MTPAATTMASTRCSTTPREAAAQLGYTGPIDAAAEGDTHELTRYTRPPSTEALR